MKNLPKGKFTNGTFTWEIVMTFPMGMLNLGNFTSWNLERYPQIPKCDSPVVLLYSKANGSQGLPACASNMMSGHASPVAHLKSNISDWKMCLKLLCRSMEVERSITKDPNSCMPTMAQMKNSMPISMHTYGRAQEGR